MKKLSTMKQTLYIVITLLFLTTIPQFAIAQIPNADFELWTSGEPDGWFSDNIASFATPVTQSSTSHSGTSAVHGEVVAITGGVYAPAIRAGMNGGGFPVSQRYATFSGYYQFSPVEGDHISFLVYLVKNQNAVAIGQSVESTAVASYTGFTVNIEYTSSDVPDTCYMAVTITGAHGNPYHLGSSYLVDDLTLSGVSSVAQNGLAGFQMPKQFALEQNYPNPFNPSTTIKFSLPVSSHVLLTVNNLLGQHVVTLLDENRQAGVYEVPWNASGLPSGVFLYRIQTENYTDTKRLILLK